MQLEIENDKEIERLGSQAAVDYMKWHEKELESLALSDQAATSINFQKDAGLDRRIYLTLRSNIAHPMDFVGGTILKSQRWADLLISAQDRVPDFNFITLLRPDASRSYEEQQEELLVVPRLQFVLVEIARCREGLYDKTWRSRERMRLSGKRFYLNQTKRFEVLDIQPIETKPKLTAKEHNDLFQTELHRQVEDNDRNTDIARRGDQLKECLTAKEAAEIHELNDEALKNRLANALTELAGEKRFVVLDSVISSDTSGKLEEACLNHFEKAGDARLHAQAIHRGDDVHFLPLFDSDLVKEAQVVLANIGHLSSERSNMLIPKLGQLAMYDGVGRGSDEKPGYVAHLDNCAEVGGEGENHRELTAILYLNQAPEGGSGGSLRCYHANETTYDEVTPEAGRLVIFSSRKLLHEVTPVLGWKRVALSVWMLRDSRRKSVSWS